MVQSLPFIPISAIRMNHLNDEMMKWTVKTNLFALLLVIAPCALAANATTQNYIQQYKHIAVNEMNRIGIPASIKMAQAILESSSGKSTLARQSNNHFGIKCGRDWKGAEVYREDDDYENGLLVRSCFRAYNDPTESFIAHSEFLSNPKSQRYQFLFELDRHDYKGWAHGLRKAGYATDPNYPSKLINVIEKYELYLLDFGINDEPSTEIAYEEPQGAPQSKQVKDTQTSIMIQPKQGEDNDPISIKNKSNKVRYSKEGVYTFSKNDRMIDVAKRFNMSLDELYIRNRIPSGSEPVDGVVLVVNSYIHLGKSPDYISANTPQLEEEILWEEEFVISGL